jgi:hypothetical protein
MTADPARDIRREQTVEITDVILVRKTSLALLCQIGLRKHWIAPSRLQRGSTVANAGDIGMIVLDRDFALQRRLIGETAPAEPAGEKKSVVPRMPPTHRCTSSRSDGGPCAAHRRTGSTFCFAHDPATTEQREASRALGIANARTARARRGVRDER